MANDDVVEIKCRGGRGGPVPVAVHGLDSPYIVGMMQALKAYEKLTVRAALNGSRSEALAALMIHPLIGDYRKAKAALDEMIRENAGFLPAGLCE
jgi:6-phospho-beta-glucosidase